MAIFRKVHIKFWSDSFIQSLTPEKKFFFLYLLTNEKTRLCGIYEITFRQISYDTGYNIETVEKLVEFFVDAGKIMVSRDTNEIAIKNWSKFNKSDSPKVASLLKSDYKVVKNKELLKFINE